MFRLIPLRYTLSESIEGYCSAGGQMKSLKSYPCSLSSLLYNQLFDTLRNWFKACKPFALSASQLCFLFPEGKQSFHGTSARVNFMSKLPQSLSRQIESTL
jgi:hypothetical protein